MLILQAWHNSLANFVHLRSWAAHYTTTSVGGAALPPPPPPPFLELLASFMPLWAVLSLGIYALASVFRSVS